MENYIIIGLIVLILGFAIWYIIRAKKKGQKCVGCPESSCSSKDACGSCCSCNKK